MIGLFVRITTILFIAGNPRFITGFNCLVALILKQSHLMPYDDQTDARAIGEAGRGRVIGILERSIVFVLIIRGNISAVGLILAAKAIARFKYLEGAISPNTS